MICKKGLSWSLEQVFPGKLREPQTSAEGNHDNLLSGNHQARGSLSNHVEDDNENIKKQLVLWAK